VGALPDTRVESDVGAYPFGTAPTEFDQFPFVLGETRPLTGSTGSSGGSGTHTGVDASGVGVRVAAWVIPDPVTRAGALHFTMSAAGPARSELFDINGRRLRVLLDEPWLEAGTHEVPIDGGIAPGVYFYRVRAGGGSSSGRFLVLE
jgi:hypothetical protein